MTARDRAAAVAETMSTSANSGLMESIIRTHLARFLDLLVTEGLIGDGEVAADAWDQGHGTSNGGCVYWPDCAENGHHVNPYRTVTVGAWEVAQ